MQPTVEATALEKRYGETVALAGVSLSIEPGEIYCLIGPNGAGKTTLVRTLTGTVTPDAGTARLLGDDPASVDHARIGVLPQAYSPPARLSVRELLRYYSTRYPTTRDPEDVLEAVGLADAADTWYEDLSGGQQRRLCVGTTLLNEPDVLVLDEPTTGIDPAGRRTVWGLIESLVETGTTVLLTTHDMDEAHHLADRIGLLADGRLLATGTPEALIDEYGGENQLTVDLDRTALSADADIAELTTSIEERLGGAVRVHDGRLEIADVAATEIGTVVETLEDREIAYTELSWEEPDLEDVYLTLAGIEESAWTADAGGEATSSARAETATTDSNAKTTETNATTQTNPLE